MSGPVAATTSDGSRLHLQHGPIDLIVEAWGERAAVAEAYRRAWERFQPLLDELKGNSILTVGETGDFIARGGLVRFKVDDARVRFEIDAQAAEKAKLRISSKLLSLADIARR